jgi:hypothetical protein
MNPTHQNSRKHLQQAIDAEIKSLEESIRALKSRRNTLSPVSSLPPEVFAAIFSLLCLPGIPSLGGKPGKNLARLRVSHVCHQWREIALNQPLLWSHVNFDTLSWAGAAEVLVRAKSVPLYLESRLSDRYWGDGKIFQNELQSRIRHLRIRADRYRTYLLRSTLKGLVSPAPTLEYLSVFSSEEFTEEMFIPDTLFNGCTPRLSCLELRNCNISWKSPLLKGLKYLDIRTPSRNARPKLAVWLDALSKLPQLKALTLHSASPVAPPSPYDVERASTLSSLTRLNISASAGDCALALAHLDLPTLTCLRLKVISHLPNYSDVKNLLPYITRHAHGPQDPYPLQSVLINSHERKDENYLDVAAWTVPDIDAEVHDPPALLGATIPPRVVLTFESGGWLRSGAHRQILDIVMVALPLNDLVMLAAQDLHIASYLGEDLSRQHFWLRHAPQWPLLQRVRLAPHVTRGFIQMLLEDNGGRERPLLPSLTDLVVDSATSCGLSSLPLCTTLMKRVEQGVPLDRLDLRTCYHDDDDDSFTAVQPLSEIVVNVLGPESFNTRNQRRSMWMSLARGLFIEDDISGEETHSDTDDDDDGDDSDTDSDEDEDDEE